MRKTEQHNSLLEVPRVQFYKDGNFVGSGRFVLHEARTETSTLLYIWGVSSFITVAVVQVALEEVVQISSHLSTVITLSSLSIVTRSNDNYHFVFTEGRMLDVVELLEHRRIIIRKTSDESDTSFTVVNNSSALRESFLVGRFPVAKLKFTGIELTNRVGIDDYNLRLDSHGRLSKEKLKEITQLVSRNGLSETAVSVMWCYWLGVFSTEQTTLEQTAVVARWRREYERCLSFTETFTKEELSNFPLLRDALHQIDMDVYRTDEDNEFYNKKNRRVDLANVTKAALKSNLKVGYCQGMMDCASIFLQVNGGNTTLAYACYRAFLLQHSAVFGTDQSPLKTRFEKVLSVLNVCKPDLEKVLRETQGYFVAQPWILVCLKRMFNYSSLVSLWTVIFSKTYGSDTLCYLVAAIFISKAHHVLLIESVTSATIYEIYRDLSDISTEDILGIAAACRKKYILMRRGCTDSVPNNN